MSETMAYDEEKAKAVFDSYGYEVLTPWPNVAEEVKQRCFEIALEREAQSKSVELTPQETEYILALMGSPNVRSIIRPSSDGLSGEGANALRQRLEAYLSQTGERN